MLQIRNMESDRCIDTVKNEFQKLGLQFKKVELGKVELKESLSAEQLDLVDKALKDSGLEILEDKKNQIVKNIKAAIFHLIYFSDELQKINLSDYLSKKINYDYAYLSNLFSGIQGITIEKYFIQKKIERVKELLSFGELSLSNIAFKLRYSSVAHLSNQFKKITGYTPSIFSKRKIAGRSGSKV